MCNHGDVRLVTSANDLQWGKAEVCINGLWASVNLPDEIYQEDVAATFCYQLIGKDSCELARWLQMHPDY